MEREDSLKERYQKVKRIAEHLKLGSYPLGRSSVDNTQNQISEVMFALSLSNHPLIESLVSDPSFEDLAMKARFARYMEDPEEIKRILAELADLAHSLIINNVLRGMRILDLGCGYEPAFAYCAREFGADEVYTVDIIPSEKLWLSDEQTRDGHIQLDLREPNAYDTLIDRIGGELDLVASATIFEQAVFADFAGRAAPPGYLTDLALALVKDGGIYFKAEYYEDEVINVRDPSINYEERVRDGVSHVQTRGRAHLQ